MKYSIDKQDKYCLLKIDEEKIDSRVAPDLKGQFILMNNEGISNIILDLSATKYIDSSGLSSILVANRLCNNSGGALVLSMISEHVEKMLTISQLIDVLNISESNEEAIEAIYLAEEEEEIVFDEEDFEDLDADSSLKEDY